MSSPLRIVPARPTEPPRLVDRVRQLQEEARSLAHEHVESLAKSLLRTREIAEEAAGGGDAFPPGVRDLARRIAEDAEAKALTLRAVVGRT